MCVYYTILYYGAGCGLLSGADKTICFKKSVKSWYAADDPPFIVGGCVAGGGTDCVTGDGSGCVAGDGSGCVAGCATGCVAIGGSGCVASGGAAVCGAVCDCWDNDFTIIK